jgi:hypothetical protein
MLLAVVNMSNDIVDFTAGTPVADVSFITEPASDAEQVNLETQFEQVVEDSKSKEASKQWLNASHLDNDQVSILRHADQDWPWKTLTALNKHIEMCNQKDVQEQVEHKYPELSKTYPKPAEPKENPKIDELEGVEIKYICTSTCSCPACVNSCTPLSSVCARKVAKNGNYSERIALIHDKEERKRILDGTDGIWPSPQGYDVKDKVMETQETEQTESWWKAIKVAHLSSSRANKLITLVRKYSDAFAKSPYEIGTFRYFKAKLPAVPGTKPTFDKQFTMNREQQEAARTAIDQMIQIGCVKPSQSHYAANLVMVKRVLNDGKIKYRAAFDARRLNGGLLASRWPNLRAEECFAKLTMSYFRSFLDLRWAFWSIVLHGKDQHKTAFYGVNSLLEHTRLPFGIAGAPSIFFLCIFLVVAGMQDIFVNFADDLACLTPYVKGKPEEYTYDLHLLHLECLFRRIIHAGFKFSPEKCNFACTPEREVDWLGHTLYGLYTRPQESKIEAVKYFPVPKNSKQALGYASLAGYYRQYIPAFAVIAKPMYTAVKGPQFIWTKAAQRGFEYLRELLCSYPILRQANPTKPYQIHCDASGYAMAGVLEQIDDDGKTYVVAYASKQLQESEVKNYSTPAKELLSIVYCLTYWTMYIAGTSIKVYSDCKAWSYLSLTAASNARVGRLAMLLSEYDIQVCFVKGKDNKAADALTRAYDGMLKCDNLAIVKDQRLNDLTAPELKEGEAVPLPKYLYQCEEHLKTNWPPTQKPTMEEKLMATFETYLDENSLATSTQIPLMWTKPIDPAEVPEQILTTTDHLKLLNDPEVSGRVALVALNETAFTPDAFKRLQFDDVKWQRIILSLRELTANTRQNSYFLRQGILMREAIDRTGYTYYTVCVPEVMIDSLLRTYHQTLYGGHYGPKRTEAHIRKWYYWPTMVKDIKLFHKRCLPCVYNKSNPMAYKQGTMRVAQYPMHICFIDIACGLPKSYDGCDSMLLAYDGFSKHIFAIPLRGSNANYVAKRFVETYVMAYGIPHTIHSDRALNLDGSILNWICCAFGIRKTRGPPYNPKSNPAERACASIGDLLRVNCSGKDQRHWTILLPFIVAGLNDVTSPTTGYSPNELFLGKIVRRAPVPLLPADHPCFSQEQYMTQMRLAQEYQWDVVRKMAEARQKARLANYNKNAFEHPFKPGTFVMVKEEQPAGKGDKKLRNRYKGPYRVIKSMQSSLVVVPWTDSDRFGEYERDKLVKRANQGDTWGRPFYTDIVSVSKCKTYIGEINHQPQYDSMLIDALLKKLGLNYPDFDEVEITSHNVPLKSKGDFPEELENARAEDLDPMISVAESKRNFRRYPMSMSNDSSDPPENPPAAPEPANLPEAGPILNDLPPEAAEPSDDELSMHTASEPDGSIHSANQSIGSLEDLAAQADPILTPPRIPTPPPLPPIQLRPTEVLDPGFDPGFHTGAITKAKPVKKIKVKFDPLIPKVKDKPVFKDAQSGITGTQGKGAIPKKRGRPRKHPFPKPPVKKPDGSNQPKETRIDPGSLTPQHGSNLSGETARGAAALGPTDKGGVLRSRSPSQPSEVTEATTSGQPKHVVHAGASTSFQHVPKASARQTGEQQYPALTTPFLSETQQKQLEKTNPALAAKMKKLRKQLG